MPQHPEPDFLKQYWEWVRNGPPQCCHSCGEYDDNGRCEAFDMEPPQEYTDTINTCEKWYQKVPF